MQQASFRQAVEAQAQALVRGDLATFASFSTPAALVQMRAASARRPRRYRIDEISESSERADSVVTYAGHGTACTVRQSWDLRDSGWTVVDATVRSPARTSWWRRMFPSSPPVDDLGSERAQ